VKLCRDFRRWLQTDRRAEPRINERVPYVIVNGPPGLPLIRLVRSPLDLLADPSLRPNATYYITRIIIPPLDRCFSLLGAEVESWYDVEQFVTNLQDLLMFHLLFIFLLPITSSPHCNFLNLRFGFPKSIMQVFTHRQTFTASLSVGNLNVRVHFSALIDQQNLEVFTGEHSFERCSDGGTFIRALFGHGSRC
jgi:hypothetical protein